MICISSIIYSNVKTSLGDYLFTFDLKSGYNHVDVFSERTKYLLFSRTFSNG